MSWGTPPPPKRTGVSGTGDGARTSALWRIRSGSTENHTFRNHGLDALAPRPPGRGCPRVLTGISSWRGSTPGHSVPACLHFSGRHPRDHALQRWRRQHPACSPPWLAPMLSRAPSSLRCWGSAVCKQAAFTAGFGSYFETIKSPQACNCCSGRTNGRRAPGLPDTPPPRCGVAWPCVPWGPALASPVQNPPPADD